jgi:hypothetical protein
MDKLEENRKIIIPTEIDREKVAGNIDAKNEMNMQPCNCTACNSCRCTPCK